MLAKETQLDEPNVCMNCIKFVKKRKLKKVFLKLVLKYFFMFAQRKKKSHILKMKNTFGRLKGQGDSKIKMIKCNDELIFASGTK